MPSLMRSIYLILLLSFVLTFGLSQQMDAIKVGESYNIFDNSLVGEISPIAAYPEIGNGIVAVIFHQRIPPCGAPQTMDFLRYVISADAGKHWNIGPAIVPPDFAGCYGIGPINPQRTSYPSYPGLSFFSRNNSSDPDSLALIYAASGRENIWYSDFVQGLILNPLSANYQIAQENYMQRGGKQYFVYSLTAQNNNLGNSTFWYTSRGLDGVGWSPEIHLNKGTYLPGQRKMEWKNLNFLKPFYFKGYDGRERGTEPLIAFDPSGKYAWIGQLGDLEGGADTSYNPILYHSMDGGENWSQPMELNLGDFPALRKLLQSAKTVVDTVGFDQLGNPILDSVAFATGKPTCYPQMDLTVDAFGNPHLFIQIKAASSRKHPKSGYNYYFNDFFYGIFDLTRSECGEWKLLQLGNLEARDGHLDNLPGTNMYGQSFFPQLSRTADGKRIFFSWTDTDTSQRGTVNEFPDLKGRGLDIVAQKLTPVVNWTVNDTFWHERVYFPHTSDICFRDSNTSTIPTLVLKPIQNGSLGPISHWYFPHISYPDSSFTQPVTYLQDCRQNPIAASSQLTHPSCGQADGNISLTVTGGKPPYQFQWDSLANFAQTPQLKNVPGGLYSLLITDDQGCEQPVDIALDEQNAPQIALDSISIQRPACHGLKNGKMAVQAAGSAWTYLWSSGETTAQASQLAGGRVTLRVTDSSGCAAFGGWQLDEPDPIRTSVKIENVRCPGEKNGAVQLAARGGHGGPYRYHWSNGWSGERIGGLEGGVYRCTIWDVAGCKQLKDIQLAKPQAMELDFSSTPTTNCVSVDGTASANVTGGTAPFDYSWAGSGNGSFIFGLNAGKYQLRVTDDLGCVAFGDVHVGNSIKVTPEVHAKIEGASFLDPDSGRIELLVSGGIPPFRYTWEHGPTSSFIRGKAGNAYVCKISQQSACPYKVGFWIPEDQPMKLSFSLDNPSASQGMRDLFIEAHASRGKPPYNYRWSTGDSLSLLQAQAPGSYTVRATDAKGRQQTGSISLNGSSHPFPQTEVLHPCDSSATGAISLLLPGNPGDFGIQWAHGPTTSSLQGLSPGDYSVTLFDSLRGCAETFSYTLGKLAAFSIQAHPHPVSCKGAADGRIDLQITGGNASYQSLWAHGATGDHLRGLVPGSYTVRVTDPAGCVDSLAVRVGEAVDSLRLAVGSGPDGNPGGRGIAFAAASGGWPPYSYRWDSQPVQLTDTAKNLFGGSYEVMVTDSVGCIVRGEAIVDAWVGIGQDKWPGRLAIVPNPNQGEFWIEFELESPQMIDIQIFNLAGERVYSEAPGMHRFLQKQVKLSNLTTGMYLLQVQIGAYLIRDKLLIVPN